MEKVSELFDAVITYALANGAKSIKDLPGCWEAAIDEHWWVAVNGHREATDCSKGVSVPPFTIYLEFNGWPAAVLNAGGGTIAAGTLANEENLLAVLREKAEV